MKKVAKKVKKTDPAKPITSKQSNGLGEKGKENRPSGAHRLEAKHKVGEKEAEHMQNLIDYYEQYCDPYLITQGQLCTRLSEFLSKQKLKTKHQPIKPMRW